MAKAYSNEEILYLKTNYPTMGSKHCSNFLNRHPKNIVRKANKMGIKCTNDCKKETMQKVYTSMRNNYSQFFNCKTPEFCYLLGYLWADGHLTGKKVELSIIKKDGIVVKKILDTIGIHYSLHKKRSKIDKYGIKRQAIFTFYFGMNLHDLLFSLGYKNKSFISHQKIMEFIPKENLHYWLRGYFDGDGCFYYDQKNHKGQASITSSYEQDWSFLADFLKNKNIIAKIKRTLGKKGKNSVIRFCGRNQIKVFGDYLYQGKSFGLDRKYQKWSSITC